MVQDNYNLKAERSVSEQDIANNLVINYGLNLPFGHGETYFSHIGEAANSALGGWRVNGITKLRSGLPIALVAAANGLSQFGTGQIRPNYTVGCVKNSSGAPHSAARASEWFNTACFAQPGHFSFGNEPRVDPALKTQGEDNFDITISKSIPIGRPRHAQVQRRRSSTCSTTPNSRTECRSYLRPAFGQVENQTNLPRTMQFALRVTSKAHFSHGASTNL